MSPTVETKQVRTDVREMKGSGAGAGSLRAVVAHTGLIDRVGDIVRPGATKASAVSLGAFNHTSVTGGVLPPGRGRVWEEGSKVILEAQFFPTESGREHKATLIGLGDLAEFSVEYTVTRVGSLTAEERKSGASRAIEAWQIRGVAPVARGAMPDTRLLDIKASPARPDPSLVKTVKRLQAFAECMKEPHGALAWDVAECSARWMSNGLVQEGPAVKWFDPDGKRLGYWRPGDDAIHLSRGLSWKEVIRVCAHEAAGHWWHNWDASEVTAKYAEQYVTRRYLEKLAA